MDISLKHPAALEPSELQAWRALRASDAAYDNPFFAPEFALAVGAVRKDARVVIARGASGVELVLPVQLSSSGLARPLGAPMCDVNGPVAMPEAREQIGDVLAKAGIEAVLGTGEGHYKKCYASHYTDVNDGVATASGMAGGARALAAGLLHAVEQGRFGPASKLAGRTRRRLDLILAVETRVGDQVRGVTRALTEDPAMARTSTALGAAVRGAAV